MFEYPAVGFHFSVAFELFPQSLHDARFQEVSGLSATINMEPYTEGGENRFTHQLPTRTTYSDLTLKRGVFLDSQLLGLTPWCRDAIDKFKFKPTNLVVSLLNEQHLPLHSWYVVGAIPKKLDIGGFNAQQGQVVIETLVLFYQYFTYLDVAALAFGAASAAAGAISGSTNISLGF